MSKKFFLSIIIFSFVFFVFSSNLALALSLKGIGGYPANPDLANPLSKSWFIYNLKPGESKEDAVLVLNQTDETQNIILYPVDSQPTNIGAFGLKSKGDEQIGIGAWIKMEKDLITLEPGGSIEVKFTIMIPENADVGEHSGAIIIQKAPEEFKPGFSGALLTTRVGIRVYQTVPGEIIKKLKITDFYYQENEKENENEYIIYLEAKNEGNVSLMPATSLKISGWGLINYQEKFLPKLFPTINWNILRGQETVTNWRWLKPKLGYYKLVATLTYEKSDGQQETLTTPILNLWIIPPLEAGILIGLIILIIILVVIKKIRNKGIGWQKYKVKKDENLVILAQKFQVSWKRLAKVNRIKKPYLLITGQEILVPPAKKEKIETKEPVSKKQKIIKWLIIILIILSGLGVISWFSYQYLNLKLFKEPIENRKVVPPADEGPKLRFGGPVPTTTPEIVPEIKKSEVAISILNGTDITGAAGKVAEVLKAEDFLQIESGNADRHNYEKTLIYFQPNYQSIAEEIKEILVDYPEIELIERVEQEKNIVVILGK